MRDTCIGFFGLDGERVSYKSGNTGGFFASRGNAVFFDLTLKLFSKHQVVKIIPTYRVNLFVMNCKWLIINLSLYYLILLILVLRFKTSGHSSQGSQGGTTLLSHKQKNV